MDHGWDVPSTYLVTWKVPGAVGPIGGNVRVNAHGRGGALWPWPRPRLPTTILLQPLDFCWFSYGRRDEHPIGDRASFLGSPKAT